MAFLRTTDNAEIYYDIFGNGEKMIILSGEIGTTVDFYRPMSKMFPEEYQVVVYDYRGHGLSERTPQPVIKSSVADDLKDLIDCFDASEVYLAGWSAGALISLAYIEKYGTEKIRGLILMDMSPKVRADAKDQLPLSWYGNTDRYTYLQYLAYMNDTNRNPLADSEEILFGDPFRCEKTMESVRDSQVSMAHQIAYTIFCASTDFRELLSEIDIPVLFCYGDKNTVFSNASAQFVENAVRKIRTETFENCGHAFFIERPEQFASAVASFAV
ncbi:MAG: alpha/beta hydrolase [Lachnospiraceae bacterium]|nr:alpha/beta hydrolase [Lachnospiraceae bacterium]